jgi:ribonuclease HI
MKEVTLYTDGACSFNPGPGGWGAVLIYSGKEKRISGYCENTTNNIMELTAVIEGLALLKEECAVNVYTDSKYIVDSATKWLRNWQLNGWKKADRKPVKNTDLWLRIIELQKKHRINWIWVKGHDGNVYNEECDRMAREKIEENQMKAVL